MLITENPNPGFDSWIFYFSSKNFGKSPAEIISKDIRHLILPVGQIPPDIPSYVAAPVPVLPHRLWVPPDQPFYIDQFNSYAEFAKNDSLFDSIKDGEQMLWLYGVVRYRDIVSPFEHETRFCYMRETGKDIGFYMAGPAGYNQCT